MVVPDRYNFDNIQSAVSDPRLIRDEMNRVLGNIKIKSNKIIRRRLFEYKYGEGVDVIERDWDNLIILDACRFDVFKSINYLQGDLEYVISRGSHSKEFCEANFAERNLQDIVYVTANPYGAIICGDEFFKIKTSFEQAELDETELKNNSFNNFKPNKLKKLAIKMNKNYPNKRIIVHFMQPHEPYLGKKAEKIRIQLRENHSLSFSGENCKQNGKYNLNSLLEAANRRYISRSEIIEVYNENLEIVLGEAQDLIDSLDGKSVVTADHGEMLGDGRIIKLFGHPEGYFSEELRKVPWLVIESDNRRQISKEDSNKNTKFSDSDIKDQLRSLGYI